MNRTILVVRCPSLPAPDLRRRLAALGEAVEVEALAGEEGALRRLEGEDAALLVLGLEAHGADGRALVARVVEGWPDVPVLVLAEGCPPDVEREVRDRGIAALLRAPADPETVAREVAGVLGRASEGGTLNGVASGTFLQVLAVDRKTCTVRVDCRRLGRRGALFFAEGHLRDARLGSVRGVEAAHRILGWPEVDLRIQNGCPVREARIRENFQALLLEAMRRRDEAEPVPLDQEEGPGAAPAEVAPRDPARAVAGAPGVEGIHEDGSWDDLVRGLQAIGPAFGAGRLRVAYLDRGDPTGYVLLATTPTTVIRVSRNCPRDTLIEALTAPA